MKMMLIKLRKINVLWLLCALLVFVLACKKNVAFEEKEAKEKEELKNWLGINGTNFASGLILIKGFDGVSQEGFLNWEEFSHFKNGDVDFFEVPYSFGNQDEYAGRVTNGKGAINEKISMVFQKNGNSNNVLARIKREVNSDPTITKKYNTAEYKNAVFFEELNGVTESIWVRVKQSDTKPIRFYKGKLERNSTNSTIKQENSIEGDNCTSVVIPESEYRCVGTGYSSSGGYNVSCGYETIGYTVFSQCLKPIEEGGGQDEFQYTIYWSSPGSSRLTNQNIIDSLNGYPCAQGVLAQMPDCNSEVAKILDSIFNISAEVSIQFSVNPSLPDTIAAQTRSANGSLSNYLAVVELNPKDLMGSQDYIAATLIHECVHAYITYQRANFGSDTSGFQTLFPIYWDFRGNDAQHNEMAGNYVDMMKRFLKGINPNLQDDVASALAWGGLEGTAIYKAKSQSEKDVIQNLNYRANHPTQGAVDSLKVLKCN